MRLEEMVEEDRDDSEAVEDLNEARELLDCCEIMIVRLLRKRNKRITKTDENELKELGIEVSAFTSQWEVTEEPIV